MSINITKDLANQYLKEFAKELRKETKKLDIDIIIVGGGSILLNYNFRQTTGDFDIIKPNKLINIKNSANKIAEKYNLNDKWINDDFIITDSFSNRLVSHANYYRTFSNHIHFYTINGEYLIAMKLMSARDYKNDLSDIIGIISENRDLTMDKINSAIIELYDDLNKIEPSMINYVYKLLSLSKDELHKLYKDISNIEISNTMHLQNSRLTNHNKIKLINNTKPKNIIERMDQDKDYHQYEDDYEIKM